MMQLTSKSSDVVHQTAGLGLIYSAHWSAKLHALLLILVGLFSVVSADPHEQNHDCFVDGIDTRVQCGKVWVPENYDAPDAKQIPIRYVVLPAVQEGAKADPLLILAGGPGQAATELAAGMNQIFTEVRKQRDIVLIDQRGTGESNPLQCELSRVDELVQPDDELDLAEVAAACLAKYPDTDMTQYHTVNAIRDFEAVRQFLGYQQVNLYGGSYGTRAGLVYLREAPAAVRAAILDAVAPTQVVIGPFGRHGADSFELIVAHCAAQAECAARFPNLGQTYLELMATLAAEPPQLALTDPLTNEPLNILMTAGRLSGVLRTALYHPTTRRLIPLTISAGVQGNYRPLLGLMGSIMRQQPLYMGLTLSVLCSEDLPRATPELLAADANNDFIGGRTAEAFLALCEPWPTFTPPASWSAPVVSDIPTLLLSGGLDPVTPPAWGDLAAQTLSNSTHLVAPYGAHTIASHTCANRLLATFLDTLDGAALDSSCLTQQKAPLPFVRNVNGAGM